MSSFADNRAYFDTIQSYFHERTGRGLVLSSRDLELLIGWKRGGATANVICRALDEAIDRLQAPPRDLHAIRRFVDQRLQEDAPAAPIFASRVLMGPDGVEPNSIDEADPWEQTRQRLRQACTTAARPEVAASYDELARRVEEARRTDADPWSILPDLDDWLVEDVFARLGEDERRLIDLEIEGRHGAHLAVMNEEARQQTLRESRRRALQNRLGLITLVE